MSKENQTFVLVRDFISSENNVTFSAYKNDAGETCYRVSGFSKGNYFASEWHQDEENAIEEANDYFKMKQTHVNSYR